MHENLWAGPELKLSYASFHLEKMQQVLGPADWTQADIAQLSSGLIVDRAQQRSLFPHFDAFLAAAHAIPFLIQCSFGYDDYGKIKSWFKTLPPDEGNRRKEFRRRLKPLLDAFLLRPLSNARNVSFHRSGHADVVVRCSGRYGIEYVGSPTEPLPAAEYPVIRNPQQPVMAHAVPLEIRPGDVTVDGKPMLDVCQEHLDEAGKLIAKSRVIAALAHGNAAITPPPDA